MVALTRRGIVSQAFLIAHSAFGSPGRCNCSRIYCSSSLVRSAEAVAISSGSVTGSCVPDLLSAAVSAAMEE